MQEHELQPHHKEQVDALLKPYLDRIAALEESHNQKSLEIMILHHAHANIISQLNEAKEHVKKAKGGKPEVKPAKPNGPTANANKDTKSKPVGSERGKL